MARDTAALCSTRQVTWSRPRPLQVGRILYPSLVIKQSSLSPVLLVKLFLAYQSIEINLWCVRDQPARWLQSSTENGVVCDMQALLLFQLLILIVLANAIPVFAKQIFGPRMAWPLDGGMMLPDGQPLLGSSKTIRGVVLSVILTPVVAIFMGLSWQVGALVALSAMAGDLVSSFLKRRLGLRPSSQAIGLDQIPESLLPFLAAKWLLPVTIVDALVGTALFFVGNLVIPRLLFRLNLWEKP